MLVVFGKSNRRFDMYSELTSIRTRAVEAFVNGGIHWLPGEIFKLESHQFDRTFAVFGQLLINNARPEDHTAAVRVRLARMPPPENRIACSFNFSEREHIPQESNSTIRRVCPRLDRDTKFLPGLNMLEVIEEANPGLFL